MGVPQDAVPMALLDLARQCRNFRVVGMPVRAWPPADFGGGRIRAFEVQGGAVEGFGGADRGFALARVERGAVGRPVQIDDVAGMSCADDGGTQVAKEVV